MTTPLHPKYPDIKVQLSGQDGNIFMVIATVSRALRKAGVEQAIVSSFAEEVISTNSNDKALNTVMQWVSVA